MDKINDGGPAFPVSTSNETNGHQDGPNTWQFPGMALRDYFAGKAMPLAWKIFDEGYSTDNLTTENIAEAAYQIADAMLAARGQQP